MKLNIALAAASVALFAVSGCGSSETNAAQDGSPEAPSPATPAETVTETVEAVPTCDAPDPSVVRLLAARWELVVASRGASDHSRYVETFSDETSDVYKDFKYGDCDGTPAMATAAMMEYRASYLAFPDQPDSMYTKVVRQGNKLFTQMGIDNAQFIPISCTGQNGAACEALR